MADRMSSLLKGLLVPLCVYVIMAVSLNLTVGILGELSLGHAGFHVRGRFCRRVVLQVHEGVHHGLPGAFILAILIGALTAAVFGMLIGIPVLRLRGDYLPS